MGVLQQGTGNGADTAGRGDQWGGDGHEDEDRHHGEPDPCAGIAAERTFGWSAQEIVGERFPPYIPPASRDEFERQAARCLAGATLTDLQVQRARKDGTTLDVRLSVAPSYDSRGEVRGHVSIVHDVTGPKQTEEVPTGLYESLGFSGSLNRSAWPPRRTSIW